MCVQVEVYQSDFNAEREARERIAGEKADLEEQLRKAGVHKPAQPPAPPPALGRPRQESQERGGGYGGHQQHHNGGGGQYNGRGDGLYHGGGGGRYNGDGGGWRNNEAHRGPTFNNNGVRDRVNNVNNVDAQFENLPATIPNNR